jgi:tetrahydromethanopterin S-methyltransferase subunit G
VGGREKVPCKYPAVCYFESVNSGMEDLSYKLKTARCRRIGGSVQRRWIGMLFISGMLTGMVVLVLYEVISEGIGSSQKLHDRYHE